jgi:hypothetical protein
MSRSIFTCPKNAFSDALEAIRETTTNADNRAIAQHYLRKLAMNANVDEYVIIAFITKTKPSLA